MVISIGALIGACLFIAILYGFIKYVLFPLVPAAASPPWWGVVYFIALVLSCVAIAWALGISIPFLNINIKG